MCINTYFSFFIIFYFIYIPKKESILRQINPINCFHDQKIVQAVSLFNYFFVLLFNNIFSSQFSFFSGRWQRWQNISGTEEEEVRGNEDDIALKWWRKGDTWDDTRQHNKKTKAFYALYASVSPPLSRKRAKSSKIMSSSCGSSLWK